jgi:hypothetical protein
MNERLLLTVMPEAEKTPDERNTASPEAAATSTA